MNEQAQREHAWELIKEPTLLALRIRVCESIADAVANAAQYLAIAGYFKDDLNLKGLALVVNLCDDLCASSVALYKSERWYSGSALVRQLIETEYLLTLFAKEPATASVWRSATPTQLRKWWNPSAMRERSGGQFEDQEYWGHCEKGGHPVPSALPLLSRYPSQLDHRYCWIDLTIHLKRVWESLENAMIAFDCASQIEGSASDRARSALADWKAGDPALAFLQSVIPKDGNS